MLLNEDYINNNTIDLNNPFIEFNNLLESIQLEISTEIIDNTQVATESYSNLQFIRRKIIEFFQKIGSIISKIFNGIIERFLKLFNSYELFVKRNERKIKLLDDTKFNFKFHTNKETPVTFLEKVIHIIKSNEFYDLKDFESKQNKIADNAEKIAEISSNISNTNTYTFIASQAHKSIELLRKDVIEVAKEMVIKSKKNLDTIKRQVENEILVNGEDQVAADKKLVESRKLIQYMINNNKHLLQILSYATRSLYNFTREAIKAVEKSQK